MAFNKVRRFYRLILRILKRIRNELRLFKTSIKDILLHMVDNFIYFIELKHHCLEVRKRMLDVRSYTEWASYAKLLDHLEGTEEWKHIDKSDLYDYERLSRRR